MIAICEKCGTKHNISTSIISDNKASFNCKECGSIVTAYKPVEIQAISSPQPTFLEPEQKIDVKKVSVDRRKTPREKKKIKASLNLDDYRLRDKMLVLFFLIPILLIIGTNMLFLKQMSNLSSFLTSESSDIVKALIEEKVGDTARKVAAECSLYLESHPGMTKQDFMKNEQFKKISVQKVGKTGYSALYEKPGSDGIWRTWTHASPTIIGIDMSKLKPKLGKSWAGFWKVYIGVKKGGESRGYYTWFEKDGSLREKYMVCAPVAGTSFIIAATTYVDEFTGPIKILEANAKKQTNITRNIVFGIFGASILLIGFIVTFFGYRLSGRIQSLTDVANRISVGELNAEIEITGKDEIGDLSDAISRMQQSIRLAMDRLRGNR
jgi:HAMP domain-containing protein